MIYNCAYNISQYMSKAMEGERRLYAVALPFLAHGHFNAFLHLSRMLATRGVAVIYVNLPSNLQILRPRVQGWEADLPLYFQELSVPDSPLPPGRQNVNNISPDMVPQIYDLIQKMKKPLEALMTELTGHEYYESRGLPLPERLVLIYDMFMGCSAAVAAMFGIRSFFFSIFNALMWLCEEVECWDEGDPLPEVANAYRRLGGSPDSVKTQIRQHLELTSQLADGVLINTFAELEPKFIQHLESRDARGGGPYCKQFWAVGPAIDLPVKDKIRSPRDAEIMEWLDGQTPRSVVYVSFGSESYISPAEVTELALGLEASGQPFLWVLRPPDSKLTLTEDDSSSTAQEWKAEVLPNGYEQRLEARCLVECQWAPQTAILAHEATGAFITHCGWNSALESVAAGIPMIAFPLQWEQPLNALLLVEETKVAVEIKKSDGVRKREEVESAVRRIMAMDEAALQMKGRVKALSIAAAAAAISNDGAARKNLDAFIQHLS